MKTLCHPKAPARWTYSPPEDTHSDIVACWPFYNNGPLKLVHRVRYGTIFFRHGEYRHAAFGFYCGNNGFISHDKPLGRLLLNADKCMVFCATCEYRATLRGEMSAEELLGYYPRFHVPIPRPPKPLKMEELIFNPS